MTNPLALVIIDRKTGRFDREFTLKRISARFPDLCTYDAKQCVEIALDVAEEQAIVADEDDNAEYQHLFALVRRLKSVAPNPDDERLIEGFLPSALVMAAALREMGVIGRNHRRLDWEDEDQVAIAFEHTWLKTRFAEGQDILGQAVRKAFAVPLEFDGVANIHLIRLLSTAYYLHEANQGESFLLPVRKLATPLRVSATLISQLIDKGCRLGILKVSNPYYNWESGVARRFQFDVDNPRVLTPGLHRKVEIEKDREPQF